VQSDKIYNIFYKNLNLKIYHVQLRMSVGIIIFVLWYPMVLSITFRSVISVRRNGDTYSIYMYIPNIHEGILLFCNFIIIVFNEG
jgi:hypothetical protein